jgi:hypothetical protein
MRKTKRAENNSCLAEAKRSRAEDEIRAEFDERRRIDEARYRADLKLIDKEYDERHR